MNHQITRLIESLITVGARILLLPLVNFYMAPQVYSLGKILFTLRAVVGLLPCVDSTVFVQVTDEVFRFLLPPTSATIISKLTDFWNATGWPVVFCSDREANLVSAEFDPFLTDNGITRRWSSAGYLQSNGAAEGAVQSFKDLYKRKKADGETWQAAWVLWRDTPQQPGKLSPAQLWYGRPIRHPRWFSPEMPSNPDTLAEARENFQKRQEAYRRRDNGDAPYKLPVPMWTPRPGSRVLMGSRTTPRVKDTPAVVLSISPSDRSCRVISDSDNRTFLLNRSKLVRDPGFLDARTTPGVTPDRPAGGM